MVATREVPRVATPLGPLELAAVLRDAHHFVFHDFPTAPRLAIAWAQNMLELGRGKAIWNHNIGNVTAGKTWTGDYYILKVPPPDPPTLRFRAHADHIDGARDFWRVLAARYPSALVEYDKGDAVAASTELRARGYFLAPLDAYARGVRLLAKEFERKVAPVL